MPAGAGVEAGDGGRDVPGFAVDVDAAGAAAVDGVRFCAAGTGVSKGRVAGGCGTDAGEGAGAAADPGAVADAGAGTAVGGGAGAGAGAGAGVRSGEVVSREAL